MTTPESLPALLAEHAELERKLADPAVHADQALARRYGRRYAELSQVAEAAHQLEATQGDLATARELAGEDPSFAAEATDLAAREGALQDRLRELLLPRDPHDGKDVILEVKAGEGGEESALFAGDLLRMYLRYADRQGWKTEILAADRVRPRRLQGRDGRGPRPGGRRGLAQAEVRGRRAPGPAGAGDRVAGPHPHQRGRRAGAARGRGRRGPDRPGRPAHRRLPVVRAGRPEREHHRLRGPDHPRARPARSCRCRTRRASCRTARPALRVLRSRLLALAQEEADKEASDARRSQVRTVDRSERVRTYNFPENRISDHRVGYKAYNLDQVLDGGLDDVIAALEKADTEALLAGAAGD